MVITLSEYKDYTQVKNPANDGSLDFIVTYVNEFVEKYCGTSFSPVAKTDIPLTTFNGEIIVPDAPLISVERVALVSSSGTVDTTDYVVEPELGIVTLNSSFPARTNNIRMSYTFGYATVPEGLKLPAFELVTYLSKREFVKSRSTGGESVTYLDPSVIPPHVRAGLDLYRYF